MLFFIEYLLYTHHILIRTFIKEPLNTPPYHLP